MMNPRDELWWAHLDGELTPAEAARLDQAMTPEERRCAAAEMEVEGRLADVLSANAACPKAAWDQVLARIHQEESLSFRAKRRVIRWGRIVLPVAAMLAIAVYFCLPEPKHPVASFLTVKDLDVTQLAAHSQVARGLPAVRAFLEQRVAGIALDPANALGDGASPFRLLGAREDTFSGEPVVQLLFDSDGQPAKLVIVHRAGIAARELGRALAEGDVRESRPIGDLIVAVIGATASRGLIRMVEDPGLVGDQVVAGPPPK